MLGSSGNQGLLSPQMPSAGVCSVPYRCQQGTPSHPRECISRVPEFSPALLQQVRCCLTRKVARKGHSALITAKNECYSHAILAKSCCRAVLPYACPCPACRHTQSWCLGSCQLATANWPISISALESNMHNASLVLGSEASRPRSTQVAMIPSSIFFP